MKKLKLTALSLGGADVLTRTQMKKVLGGDFPASCASNPCDGSCTMQSGTCKGHEGTCGWTGDKCLCGGAC